MPRDTMTPPTIALFGAGSRGVQCLRVLRNDPRFRVSCIFDNDPARWGSTLDGVPIRRPDEDACREVDAIVLASTYASDILAQLLRMGLGTRVALSPEDLTRRLGAPEPVGPRSPGDAFVPSATDLLDAARPIVKELAAWFGSASRVPVVPAASVEAACTICCSNYLAFAMVLARSFLRHHPSHRFFVALVDRPASPVGVSDDPRIEVVAADGLGIPHFEAFAFKYDVLELNTAVKPFFLAHLLRRRGVQRVLYLDPDVLVMSPLGELFDRLADTPLLLTPHITRPYDDEGLPGEIDILRAGTFNLGFIGLAAHPQTDALLHWWSGRVYDGCTREIERGYFVDQKWLDLAPSLFPASRIVRAPGYNVAYWNLHEREISREGMQFLVNGEPLRFFHFSGLDVRDLESVSRHQNRVSLPSDGALRELFEVYRHLLVERGHLELQGLPYAFGSFDNGVPIPEVVRRIYRDARLAHVYPDPFSTATDASFYRWLGRPARPGALVTNLLATLHSRQPELRAAYPDLYGAHQLPFLLHMTMAADLYALPPDLCGRALTEGLTAGGREDSRSPGVSDDGQAPVDPPAGTVWAPTFQASGVPRIDMWITEPLALALDRAAARLPEPGTSDGGLTVHDRTRQLTVGPIAWSPDVPTPRSTVAYWMWHQAWPAGDATTTAREVWVPTIEGLEGAARTVMVPVARIPVPIGVVAPAECSRSHLGLEPDAFVFLSVLDPVLGTDAGGIVAALQAFRSACPVGGATAARLLVWCPAGCTTETLRREVTALSTDAARIAVLERTFSPGEAIQLVRSADCYLALGPQPVFDVWMAYAMWHGRPVIATSGGGHADLASLNNSFVLDGTCGAGRGAAVDGDPTVVAMRRALDEVGTRRRLGDRAAQDLRGSHALDVVTALVQRRFVRLATDADETRGRPTRIARWARAS